MSILGVLVQISEGIFKFSLKNHPNLPSPSANIMKGNFKFYENRLRKLFQSGELNENSINTIMNEEKANQKPMFKMSMERLQKYSPKADERQMQEFIIKACEYYAKYLQKKRNREAR